jgi:hypothetical protein
MNSVKIDLKLIRWRLFGKELRQLRPLFAALPFIVLAFLGVSPLLEFISTAHGSMQSELAFELAGVVFSIGAVGLLVCQEKEQRSLHWLAGLPIPALEIVRSKLVAGIVGTGLVWLVSVLTLLVLRIVVPVSFDVYTSVQCLIINLYILMAGFAIVWRLESTLGSLLLLLPVAFIPAAVAQAADVFVFPATRSAATSAFTTSVFLLLCYLILGTIALYLLHRWGVRALSATPTRAEDLYRKWMPYRVDSFRSRRMDLMSPASGLTWQVLRQNGWSLAAIVVLLAGSWIPIVLEGVAAWVVQASMAGAAVSWLGVVTFAGDSVRNQVRFLADRGVSRWTMWWTRQLAPLSILSLYFLLGLGIAVFFGYLPAAFRLGEVGRLLLYAVLLGLTIFSVSQWLAQQIPSAILATVVVPPVSLGSVGFLVMLLYWLGIDGLYLSGVAVVPLIGTWWAMPAWMDRRMGVRHIVTPLCIAMLLSIIIAAFVASPLSTPPKLDPRVFVEMQAFRSQYTADIAASKPRSDYAEPNSIPAMVQPTTNGSLDDQSLEGSDDPLGNNSTARYLAKCWAELERIEKDLALANHALPGHFYTVDGMFLEMLAELAPHWNMPQVELQQLFTRILRAHLQLTRRIRQSNQLLDQDVADIAEIWQLRLLLDPANSRWLDDDLYNMFVSHLTDADGRRMARRRAIVNSWEGLEQQQVSIWRVDPSQQFFEVYIQSDASGPALWKNHIRKQRALDLLSILWRLSAKPQAVPVEDRVALAQMLGAPETLYGAGEVGQCFRIDDATKFIPDLSTRYGWGYAGRQMGAGWELQAQQLRPRERRLGTVELESEPKGALE